MPKKLLPKWFEEEDIIRWKKKAKEESRSLNNWMEVTLNKACPRPKNKVSNR